MKRGITTSLMVSLCAVFVVHGETAFKDLLDGNSLAQWTNRGKPITQDWTVDENGVLHLVPNKTGGIATREKFKDFELVFEWKVAKGSNSGVFYRQAKGHAPEYQILDDGNHVRGKVPLSSAAALYDIKGRSDDTCVKPYGQWNMGRIIARGTHLEHWLNGVKVVEIEVGSDEWKERFNKSKFVKTPDKINPLYGLQEGCILIQDHGGEVWYRNMKIRML